MIADFEEIFGKQDNNHVSIPEEILNNINQELPSTLFCYEDPEKGFIVTPKPNGKVLVNFTLDPDEKTRERLKNIPKEKWMDYFYRTQQCVKVKYVYMGDENKKIPIEQIGFNPLEESPEIIENYMYPEKFPDPFQMPIEIPNGKKIVLEIQRQPYDSMNIVKFANVNYPAIKMEIFINEVEIEKSSLTYSVNPSKAQTVEDAILAIQISKYMQNGEALIEGKKMFRPNIESESLDMEQLDKWDTFWNCLKKLEEILDVSFVPEVELAQEDILFIGQLEASLINGKEVKWEHPFDHLHVEKMEMKSSSLDDLIGKGKMQFGFMEGPIEASLLGVDFQLYSETWMKGFVITGMEWDDDTHTGGEMYISDEGNEKWVLTRKFMTKKEYLEKVYRVK